MRQYEAIHARACRDRQERLRREADARRVRSRYRMWGALLMSGAVLTTGVGAGVAGANGVDHVAISKTTEADIDAVPGLRAQLHRQAETADAGSPTPRTPRKTTQADIDRVPGLRAQIDRQAESGPVGSPAAALDSDDAGLPPAGVIAATAVATAAAAAGGGLLHRRRRLAHELG